MPRLLFLIVAFALLGTGLASIGCKKKDSPAPDDSPGPGGGPGPKPKGKRDSIPLSEFPYDPQKPEVKIDLAKFSSFALAKDPAAAEWLKKKGKLAEVYGVMGYILGNVETRRESVVVRDQFGKNAIECELLFPPDWRKVSPGRIVTMVGILDVQQNKSGDVLIKLKDAHPMAMSNVPGANPEVSAEQLGKDYSANAAAFDKKWKVSDKYYYVTGTLKRIDKYPLPNGRVVNKYILAAGPVELVCGIYNERGVAADPPKTGDKITMLLECQGYDSGFKGISMSGVYVDK
jgi:hypothetical protein